MRRWTSFLLAATLLVLPLTACGDDPSATAPAQNAGGGPQAKGRLATVLSRGKLICGVSGELPGFSFVTQDGKYSGLDVDVCRAIAAALFDNPDAVEFRNLNAKERFTAVQTGEVDILSRNTTWTISRDTSTGLEFAPVVFYDGQGIMVKRASGAKTLADLRGKSICIQTGTTTEQNLTDQMRKRNIPYTPVVFEDVNTTFATYAQGRCDGVTADRSQLISRRTTLPNPNDHVILEDALSEEPLAPAVADGDAAWSNVVRWVVFALLKAEELSVTTQNVTQQTASNDPTIKRFLGTEGDLGKGMGLSNDFAVRIVKHVGNYGEVYDRNLGPKTSLNLPRGQNTTWTKGGLLFAPPFR
ncbi:amino acid ABC transporter substrate-binding protein [Leptolyngbya sp. FACHB-36]|uniref:amino acid ABC transporter substrate-binding protein n=1 Tax=Leptolyngbya sp. FACHB-36 TaxID=2692808 RepID=UPI0016810D0A|nr:amino acid ABC transporter substrate-binding protein [Leptolyngbya sp. FACHB-36]MBD2022267.1 amino acid ABC transporter substrate-binding protein [Leptolyngbya sp. FACHB-36]